MKTNPGIKAIAIIASIALLIPISINWYSFLTHTFSDDNDTSVNPLKYNILTDSTAAVSKCLYLGIDTISIPEKVLINGNDYTITCIGNKAFKNCSGLKSIEIPESVTSIGKYAFEYCSSLKSIKIPASVTSIEESTFNGCYKLNNVEIPESVTHIGNSAFKFCYSLESIKIPASVTSIEESTFNGCSKLRNVEIPESVTIIGKYAFQNCSSLYWIEIPTNVTKIEDYAFDGCNNPYVIIYYNSGDDVVIGYNAFKGCSFITYKYTE